MIIYTYQPQSLIDEINLHGHAFVEFTKTNLYLQTQIPGKNMEAYYEAYLWMGMKLSEKTGVWMKGVYGDALDMPKDKEGDYIDDLGRKMPLLPFWGWYITDGKNQKPDRSYCFDGGGENDVMDWNLTRGETRLITLEIPERLVLLSDANAWYCALEGRPCYEFDEDEEDKNKRYYDLLNSMTNETDIERKTVMAQKLWDETVSSWDNILRLEGRRLRSFSTPVGIGLEKYDIQAAFPIIMKDWIKSVEEVW